MADDLPRWTTSERKDTVGRISHTTLGPNLETLLSYSRDGLLASEGHYRLPIGCWNGGGPFYVWRDSLQHTGLDGWAQVRYGISETWALGGLSLSLGAFGGAAIPSVPKPPESKMSDLAPWYTTGRARTQPGAPVASTGLFLIELGREGLPSLPLSFLYTKGGIFKAAKSVKDIPKVALAYLTSFRTLGSQYLNVEFGWKPFLSDLRAMYTLQSDVDKAFAKLLKENRQGIHRRATLDQQTSVQTYERKVNFPWYGLTCPTPTTISGGSSYTRVRTTTTKRWFAARYHYYIPDAYLDSWMWNAKAKLALMGALPSPELIWNALPWTWLVDWFANVDDLASALSYTPAENLYTDYAFVMEHVLVQDEATCSCWAEGFSNELRTYSAVSSGFNTKRVLETKARHGGNLLFGIGITGGLATARQLGILAALGASRSRL